MYKILIADDEQTIREGLRDCFEWEKFNIEVVACVSNGREAYTAIKNLSPDIILTDIKMPEMSGLELIEITKKEFPDICVIILTGYADFEFARKAMRHGVMYYLLKPIWPQELEEVLRDIIGNISAKRLDDVDDKIEDIQKGKYDEQINKVFEYVEAHLEDPDVTLGYVAEKILFMSSGHFGKMFKKATGKFYTQYVMERRIEKAKRLLEETDLRGVEIAEKVGFCNNYPYFITAFKRYTSMTPQEWRNKIGEDNKV